MSIRQKKIKKVDRYYYSNSNKDLSSFGKKLGKFFVKIFKVLDSKLTIMIVPHSKKRVINFQTNVFALSLSIFLTIAIIFSFVYFNKKSISASMTITSLENENRETLASLDLLRDENANLFQAAKHFQTSLSQSLSLLGINQVNGNTDSSLLNSDLSSLFNRKEIKTGSSKELADIQELTTFLEGAVEPIEQIGKMLKTQQSLFTEIPSVCPVKATNLHVSMPFGPNIHPTRGNWYIHKGLDLSTYHSGDPVISTASGQVVTVGYDTGYGNYIIIKHNHGFYTRYAHLSATRVQKGQLVNQGDVIGNIGNTGISTGPHLHYEIHIGSDVVDPAKYLNIKLATK
ncbi:MAG: M23 family metallopeptidase [Treponema sp.]|nr:M23 family metallopeptidase [Treponema sp.]